MQNRAGEAVLALVVGLLFGVVGTFGHRSVIGIGAANLPWGLVVAVLGAACFLLGIRLYTGSRLVTLVGAVGLLVPIFLFSLEGPGGSVVIAQDVPGRVWAYAPIVIALVAVASPLPGVRGRASRTE